MKERPILFSGPMVQAILGGRKMQTRRVMKPQPEPFGSEGGVLRPLITACPYGYIGDRLWVRETWQFLESDNHLCFRAGIPPYTHNCCKWYPGHIWRSPLFMPRKFSRITLEITGVRVERLHQITQADIRREGGPDHSRQAANLGTDDAEYLLDYSWFSNAWEKINGKKHPWASNPWVWVVEFKRCT